MHANGCPVTDVGRLFLQFLPQSPTVMFNKVSYLLLERSGEGRQSADFLNYIHTSCLNIIHYFAYWGLGRGAAFLLLSEHKYLLNFFQYEGVSR